MKNFIVLFFSLALGMSSCVKEANQIPEQAQLTENIENRGGPDCGPEGDCEPSVVEQVINVPVFGCSVTVIMRVTKCVDSYTGDITVYFEEEEEAIDINGDCDGVSLEFIEAAYTEAIFRYVQSQYRDQAPFCSSGGFVLSSKQIKTECQKYCIGPSLPGTTNYYWSACANVQSCCIVTQKWCRDGEGNMIQDGPPSNEQVGECEGFFEGTCFQQPMPINYNPCNTARCN